MKMFCTILLLALTSMLYSSEKDDISNFLKTLKSPDDINSVISVKSVISYEDALKDDFIKRTYLIFNSIESVTIEDFKGAMSNKKNYDYSVKSMSYGLSGINFKIFELPFEYKKLKDGRVLVLFDEPNKKFKMPMLLIPKDKTFLIDALGIKLLLSVRGYNNREEQGSNPLVLEEKYLFFQIIFGASDWIIRKDLDHSYMLAFDVFYDSEDKDVNFMMVLFGAIYKEVLIESGRKLLDKNSKMSEKERKLRALQFYYVKEYLKDPIVKEAEAAYAVAEEIYKKMDEKEIKLYTQVK